jgi:hypothetical protein
MKKRVTLPNFYLLIIALVFLAFGPSTPLWGQQKKSTTSLSKKHQAQKKFPSDSNSNLCSPTLRSLLKQKDLSIVYVFGYKDARPARYVGDRYERAQLVQKVTAPCVADQLLCNFQRDPEDGYLFHRYLVQEAETQKIQLQIVGSSATEDDAENRTLSFQKWQSRSAQQALLTGISEADIVLYSGHSRAGGGPDFAPPVLKKASSEVNYAYYQNKRSQFSVLIKAIKKAKKPPALLGLFSCKADEHFRKELQGLNKGISLLAAPHLISYQEALDSSVQAMEALLKMDCNTLQNLFALYPSP